MNSLIHLRIGSGYCILKAVASEQHMLNTVISATMLHL